MAAQKPSYILSPNYQISPSDGPLQLGSIICDPKNPTQPLNRYKQPTPPRVSEFENIGFEYKTDGSTSLSFGIALSFLATIFGIGPDVKAKSKRGATTVLKCEKIITRRFDPSPEYLVEAFQNTVVDLWSNQFLNQTKSLYMVTGVKIAHGTSVETSGSKDISSEVKVTLDGTSQGVPLSVTPGIGFERQSGVSAKFAGGDDFVLAYQLWKIKRKSDDTIEGRESFRWAQLSNEEISENELYFENWEVPTAYTGESADMDTSNFKVEHVIDKLSSGVEEDIEIIIYS